MADPPLVPANSDVNTAMNGTLIEPEARATQRGAWRRLGPIAQRLPALVLGVVALMLLPRLADYALHSWSMLLFPWQVDYDEGVNAHASWLVAQSVNIYRPNTAGSFVSATHPPLFFVLNGLAMKLGGLNLLSGRLLAFAGALATGALLWVWTYIETRQHAAGALSALVWFSLGPVYVWSTFYKQDMLALALGLVGCVMIAAAMHRELPNVSGRRDSPQPRRSKRANWIFSPVYWSILPMVLALWTKQSALVPFAAGAVYLLLHDRRLAARWILVAAASVIVPSALLDLYTGGGYHEHLLIFRHYSYSVQYLSRNITVLWTYHTPLILVAFATVLIMLRVALTRRKPPLLSVVYFCFSVPAVLIANGLPTWASPDVSTLQVAKYNQLLDILAPLCLLLGIALGTAWRGLLDARGAARKDWAWLTSGVLLLSFMQVGMVYRQAPSFWYPPLSQPLALRGAAMERMLAHIKAAPDPVLSEDIWLLMKAGRLVPYDDPAAMAVEAQANAWDQAVLLDQLRRRTFAYVVTEFDLTSAPHSTRWSDQALRALKENYAVFLTEPNVGVVSARRSAP